MDAERKTGSGAPEPALGSLPDGAVGRFEILARLGAGGMGVVYLARDPMLARKVAIKLLAGTEDEQSRARLLNEARAMARLSHPNVIPVYEVGLVGDRVFVAMEYVPGSTLRDWVRAQPRAWEALLDVHLAAGRGLAAAHAAGLVHRDFKPENVLVGDDGRVRVLDFGIARLAAETLSGPSLAPRGEASGPPAPAPRSLEAEALAETRPSPSRPDAGELTQPGAVVGTPAYMSPEQHDGKVADHRSDQFSFCVALWQALYGRPPFQGETVVQIAFATLMGRIEAPPAEHGRPPALEAILRKGLSAGPEERFSSMDALLSALGEVRAAPAGGGELVGHRYALLEPLDEPGGFRAVDRLAGGVVEVHRLDGELAPAEVVKRLGELAGLRHPNLERIVDYGLEAGKRPFVVSEPVERGTDIVDAARDAHHGLQVSLLAQLLRALGYVHRRGLTHGHLTRERVLVSDGRVKVTGLHLGAPRTETAAPWRARSLRSG